MTTHAAVSFIAAFLQNASHACIIGPYTYISILCMRGLCTTTLNTTRSPCTMHHTCVVHGMHGDLYTDHGDLYTDHGDLYKCMFVDPAGIDISRWYFTFQVHSLHGTVKLISRNLFHLNQHFLLYRPWYCAIIGSKLHSLRIKYKMHIVPRTCVLTC